MSGPRAVADGVALVRAPNPGPMTLEGTNTYVVRGPTGAVVVDPGPLDESHLHTVAGLGPVACIVLTHGHPDHSEGAARFAGLTGGRVLARDPAYGDPLPPDGELVAGVLRVVDAPGHTADSVCFLLAGREQLLLTGDTVLGRGTTVVAFPDGRLADYLSTLQRLGALVANEEVRAILPGHGPVVTDPASVLDGYLAHRGRRLEEVRAAVAAGDRTPAAVVRRVYADVDRALWPAAELSVRAQLDHLEQEAGEGPPL